MAIQPSIKGSVFESVVGDVKRVAEAHELSRDDLRKWLAPEDLMYLDDKILVSEWYDVGAYARMNEMLLAVEGGGDPEYLRARGRATAEKLIDAGIYQQMEYLHRTNLQREADPEERFRAFGRDLKLLTTLSSSILNFSKWHVEPDPAQPDRYVIEVSEAEEFPDALAWRSDGLINRMATEHGEPDLWNWDRPAPGTIIFHMARPL